MADYDLIVIGGGINGTAIARDAAGRGLHVLLAEQNDLASGTSWASSKLIHGGLRYLEQGAFKLVREGLQEREVLLRMAPHIIWPARFVLPHHKDLRPAWMLRIGLYIYDLLGGNSVLPNSRGVNLQKEVTGACLQTRFTKAFEYSDCRADDARLVALNALDAKERGATILTRTRFKNAQRKNGLWEVKLNDKIVTSRGLVNATGPWIEEANEYMPPEIKRAGIKMVQGSHIVVPRLFTHDKSYIFQNKDGRIVFAIPYEENFTMLGTTDYNYSGDPAKAHATAEEINYLCTLANSYFKKQITPQDVIWSFAGIRALYDDRSLQAKNLSRDFLLELDTPQNTLPLLSVYGGKLTAARHLAETAITKLASYFKMSPAWTAQSHLPGGDFDWRELDILVENTRKQWPFLTPSHARRLVRAYGTRLIHILGDAQSMANLGICFGADLTEREVRYLMQHEWAQQADDILWLRSKMGLHLTKLQQQALANYMAGV